MQANSKRQPSSSTSRPPSKLLMISQEKCRSKSANQTVPPISREQVARPVWLGRPNTENYQDEANPSNGFRSLNSSSADMKSHLVNTEKTKYSALGLHGSKEQPMPQNFGNDYSDAFLHRGILPQTWVQNATDVFKGYPKLQRLHHLKQEQFNRYAARPIGIRCPQEKINNSLREMINEQIQFDVIMVHGCVESFPFQRLCNLPLDDLSSRPSLIFLWVPATKIAEGRQLMTKWGFRKGEDIAYIINSFDSHHAPSIGSWHNAKALFRPSTWHCLMGLKGTMRRSTNTELIHCNVDTDVIFEKPKQRSSIVPEEIYTMVENFTSMSRKIHILPEESTTQLPVRLRPGWVILSPDVFSAGYLDRTTFRDRETIPVSREIDLLRPQTPPLTR